MKVLDLYDDRGVNQMKTDARKESMIWKRVGENKHVVSLMEWYMDDSFSYYVMERCNRSLYDNLLKRQDPPLQEFELLDTFRQMLLGLQHCHSKGVIHRDIKPANFLVGFDGLVKLCDFGLAALEKEGGTRGIAGTAPFMSPEMILRKPYDQKTDIFSLGSTCYLMLYGTYAHQIDKNGSGSQSKAMQRAIATNNPKPTYIADVSKGLSSPSVLAKSFVQALLERDPRERPTATQALALSAMKNTRKPAPGQGKSLTPAVQLAKQHTAEFKVPVDPTVAKTMDKLLEQLQAQHAGGDWSQSFSLPARISTDKTLFDQTMCPTRSHSHAGEVSLSKLSFSVDDVSDCSTTASGGSRGPVRHVSL